MDRKWRRRFMEWTALGALGAGATYCAYQWYKDRQTQLEDGKERSSLQLLPLPLAGAGIGKNGRGLPTSSSSSDVVQLESNLHSHFESVQEITQTQTVPEAMKLLRERLLELTALDGIMQQIRQLQGAGDQAAAAEKLRLWQELSRTSFTRSLAACWLAPLLMLFLKIKINILGRHLYLESTLEALNARQPQAYTHGAAKRPPLPPKLSSRAQEMFMHSSQHFLVEGTQILHTKMYAVVERVVGNIPLQQPVDVTHVLHIMSDILREFEQEVGSQDWAAVLLGHDLQVPLSMSAPDGQWMTVIPVEGSMVDEMNAEVRAVLGGPHFLQALHSTVKHTTQIVAQHIEDTFRLRMGSVRPPAPQQAVQPVPAPTAAPGAVSGTAESASGAPGTVPAAAEQEDGDESNVAAECSMPNQPSDQHTAADSSSAAGPTSDQLPPHQLTSTSQAPSTLDSGDDSSQSQSIAADSATAEQPVPTSAHGQPADSHTDEKTTSSSSAHSSAQDGGAGDESKRSSAADVSVNEPPSSSVNEPPSSSPIADAPAAVSAAPAGGAHTAPSCSPVGKATSASSMSSQRDGMVGPGAGRQPLVLEPVRVPFARVLPIVASGGEQLFGQHAAKLLQVVGDLPAVRSMCALVYVQGPS